MVLISAFKITKFVLLLQKLYLDVALKNEYISSNKNCAEYTFYCVIKKRSLVQDRERAIYTLSDLRQHQHNAGLYLKKKETRKTRRLKGSEQQGQ